MTAWRWAVSRPKRNEFRAPLVGHKGARTLPAERRGDDAAGRGQEPQNQICTETFLYYYPAKFSQAARVFRGLASSLRFPTFSLSHFLPRGPDRRDALSYLGLQLRCATMRLVRVAGPTAALLKSTPLSGTVQP